MVYCRVSGVKLYYGALIPVALNCYFFLTSIDYGIYLAK